MGPFGLPWLIAGIYLFTLVGIPVLTEIFLRSKWWKKKADYYFSFNEKK